MKVQVTRARRSSFNHDYEAPVEIRVDGKVIRKVHWVNGPPWFSIEIVRRRKHRR